PATSAFGSRWTISPVKPATPNPSRQPFWHGPRSCSPTASPNAPPSGPALSPLITVAAATFSLPGCGTSLPPGNATPGRFRRLPCNYNLHRGQPLPWPQPPIEVG